MKLLIYTHTKKPHHTDIQIITLGLNMFRAFHVFSKENDVRSYFCQHCKLHDLKTTINYLQVEIILEDRTLERHNMFNRRDEVHKKKKKKI